MSKKSKSGKIFAAVESKPDTYKGSPKFKPKKGGK